MHSHKFACISFWLIVYLYVYKPSCVPFFLFRVGQPNRQLFNEILFFNISFFGFVGAWLYCRSNHDHMNMSCVKWTNMIFWTCNTFRMYTSFASHSNIRSRSRCLLISATQILYVWDDVCYCENDFLKLFFFFFSFVILLLYAISFFLFVPFWLDQ